MDENIMKYVNDLHALEIDPNTNWNDYGDLARYLNYEWKENEKWHDEDKKQRNGKWVSHEIHTINLAIFPLIAREECKVNFLYFANKVMEATE